MHNDVMIKPIHVLAIPNKAPTKITPKTIILRKYRPGKPIELWAWFALIFFRAIGNKTPIESMLPKNNGELVTLREFQILLSNRTISEKYRRMSTE